MYALFTVYIFVGVNRWQSKPYSLHEFMTVDNSCLPNRLNLYPIVHSAPNSVVSETLLTISQSVPTIFSHNTFSFHILPSARADTILVP